MCNVLQTVFRSVLATLVFATAFFVACSSEEEQTINNELNLMHRPLGVVSLDLEEKVTSFYGDNITFTIGRTASTIVDGIYYDCTELIIDYDTRARGYIFSEQLTGNFLYIADVDRINHVLTFLNILTNERKILSDINNHSDYASTNEFDIIRIIETPDHPIRTNGGFWGTYCEPVGDHQYDWYILPATPGFGSPSIVYCMWECTETRFWIVIDRYTKSGGCL